VLDSLERRGLIIEVGRQDTPGHPRLFGTTLRFLQVVGLERIEDLPPLPEGLTVPELPVGDWEVSGEATPAPTEAPPAEAPGVDSGEVQDDDDSTFEVRGEAVEPVMGGAADPDEGYDFADDPDESAEHDSHSHDDGDPPAPADQP